MISNKDTLSKADLHEWFSQTFIYSIVIPSVLVFLTSLQGGADLKVAIIAACYAVISALVNLHSKYSSGIQAIPANIPSFSTIDTVPVTGTMTVGSTVVAPDAPVA